jgi:hypothetical protein
VVLKQCGSDQGSQRPPEAATAQQMPGRDAYLDGLLACEAEAAIEGSPTLAAMPVLVHAGRRAGGRRAARPGHRGSLRLKPFSASSAAKEDDTGLGGPASSESGALLRSLR